MIYSALRVIVLMWADPLLGEVGGGWALEFPSYLGPTWNSPIGWTPFHRAQKTQNSRAQPPPTSPHNGYARIQNIMHGAE